MLMGSDLMNNINWRNPEKELPKEDENVWILLQTIRSGNLQIRIDFGQIKTTKDGIVYVQNSTWQWEVFREKHLGVSWLPLNELSFPDWFKKYE